MASHPTLARHAVSTRRTTWNGVHLEKRPAGCWPPARGRSCTYSNTNYLKTAKLLLQFRGLKIMGGTDRSSIVMPTQEVLRIPTWARCLHDDAHLRRKDAAAGTT